MTIYGLWYGGAGYAHGYAADDMEAFDSVEHARTVLAEREGNGGWCRLDTFYVHRDREPVCMPTVEGSSMTLYPEPDGGEPYARLVFGPRGGVRVESF